MVMPQALAPPCGAQTFGDPTPTAADAEAQAWGPRRGAALPLPLAFRFGFGPPSPAGRRSSASTSSEPTVGPSLRGKRRRWAGPWAALPRRVIIGDVRCGWGGDASGPRTALRSPDLWCTDTDSSRCRSTGSGPQRGTGRRVSPWGESGGHAVRGAPVIIGHACRDRRWGQARTRRGASRGRGAGLPAKGRSATRRGCGGAFLAARADGGACSATAISSSQGVGSPPVHMRCSQRRAAPFSLRRGSIKAAAATTAAMYVVVTSARRIHG